MATIAIFLQDTWCTLNRTCTTCWSCCPSWLRLGTIFLLFNIVGDLAAFPFVHTFWNLMNFEGWFINE